MELPNFCPKEDIKFLGCFIDNEIRTLQGSLRIFPQTNSIRNCIDNCFQLGHLFAGVEYGNECHCGNRLIAGAVNVDNIECEESKCPGNKSEVCGGTWRILIFSTGVPVPVKLILPEKDEQRRSNLRIVFLLTVTGRYSRQIVRLLNNIYSPKHYYYIHVDNRMDYLFRELLELENSAPNIKLKRNRFAPIWCGATLLQTVLDSLKDIFELFGHWKWDFVINLSESDFPIMPIEQFENFLSANRHWNFVDKNWHSGWEYFEKMAFDWAFYECDYRLWRLAKRQFPKNIRIDGNADWFVLNREFLHYVTYSEDALVKGLKLYFQHSIVAMESFFQTVLANSKFCQTHAGMNLRLLSWQQGKGCLCDNETVIDWCACSPTSITYDWISNQLTNTNSSPIFFARKFDPMIDQAAIDFVERNINTDNNKLETVDGKLRNQSFWFNDYHYLDKSPEVDPAKLVLLENLLFIAVNHNAFKSDVETSRVLELNNLLQNAQVFLILKYAVVDRSGRESFMETKFRYQNSMEIVSNSSHVDKLEVGTDWDVKDLIFRNYAKAFGPHSNVQLRLEVNFSSETEVTSHWLDPMRNLTSVAGMTATSEMNVLLLKPMIEEPRKTGIWTVEMFVNGSLTHIITFPILRPDGYAGNAQLTGSNYCPVGIRLSNLSNLYEVDDSCLVIQTWNNESNTSLHVCERNNWSSLSPDPKSTFNCHTIADSVANNGRI